MTLDAELARLWLGVERGIVGNLNTVAREMCEARARGQVVTLGTLAGNPRYSWLVGQLGTEAGRFGNTAATEIAREAMRQGGLSQAQVRSYLGQIGAAPYTSATLRVDAFPERQATYRWLLDNGVPADALEGMNKAMLRAIQRGESPAAVVRAAREGMARGLNRALLVSRDQVARARLAAADAEMQASGQVWMKQRIVDRAGHPCMMCLARDGETIPVDQPAYDLHPNGHCVWRPVLTGKQPVKRSAESWLRSQSAEYQRDVLGNARYEQFRDGKIDLASQVVDTWHPTFGRGGRPAHPITA